MDFNFKNISPFELRSKHFEDSEIVSHVDKEKASVLAPKAKDCQRQLNESTSVWAVDRKRFLFIFSSDVNEDGQQKVSVWGFKSPGEYQRIKTIWVSCHDYIFEAVAMFLTDYFELFILKKTYSSDVRMFYDIEERINEAVRYTPFNLKQKVKLLKSWNDIMPRFNQALSELDHRIDAHIGVPNKPKSKGRMKTFFQDKGATYNIGDNFTVAVRKEHVEYYLKLKKGHAVANVEIFQDLVQINIACRDFGDQLFDRTLKEGFDPEKHPKLLQLLEDKKFTIITDRTGEKDETYICRDVKKSFPDWLEAIADKEVREEINYTIHFFLDLYNEQLQSPFPSVKSLAKNFYD